MTSTIQTLFASACAVALGLGASAQVISAPSGCVSIPNSTGVHSTMIATGATSRAQNDVTLVATVPPATYGYFITSQTPGFVPAMPGHGVLCLGSNVGRFQSLVMLSDANGEIAISTVLGQWDVMSIPQASGPYAAVPGNSIY